MKEITFEAVPVGHIVEMDIFNKPTLFAKLYQSTTHFNCVNLISWTVGYINPNTTVRVVGELELEKERSSCVDG